MRHKYSYARNQRMTFTMFLISPIIILLYLYNLGFEHLGLWSSIAFAALSLSAGYFIASYTINTNLYGASRMAPLPIYTLSVVMLSNPSTPLLSAGVALGVALMMWYFLRSYDYDKSLSHLFAGSMLCGALPLVVPSALPLVLLPLIASILFGRARRSFYLSLVAIFIPLIIASYAAWVMGGEFLSQAMIYLERPFTTNTMGSLWDSPFTTAFVAIAAVLLLFSALRLDSTSRAHGSRTKLIFGIAMLLLGGTMALLPAFGAGSWVILAAPLALVITSLR